MAKKVWFASHQSTPKGLKVEIEIYVYPDGHGNLLSKDGANTPVADAEQAIAAFANIWRFKRLAATREAKRKARTTVR